MKMISPLQYTMCKYKRDGSAYSGNIPHKTIYSWGLVCQNAGIKGRDKWLYPIATVGCNYLCLPLITASGNQVLNYELVDPPH